MPVKRTAIIAAVAITMAGCAGRHKSAEEDMIEYGKIGYADLISFIVQGYQCGWDGMSPKDQKLSSVYSYSSEFAGFTEKDVDGDGVPELLIGDQFEDGSYLLYDIYTINPVDGLLIHLAKGGERDTFTINGSGVIIENGSNSAFDSVQRGFLLQDGRLIKLTGDDFGWEDSLMNIELVKFSELARPRQLIGGYTEQREPSEEEMAMFRAATASEDMVFTPLSVSTQVVAGTNYRFWCRYQDKESGGHCWVVVFKPLPGRGEPEVSSIEKES